MDVEQVSDRDSFVEFATNMRNQLQAGSETWENVELPEFLEALTAWVRDWPGPFDANPWRHAAALMQAGASYE